MTSNNRFRIPLPSTLPGQVAFVLLLAGAIVFGAVAMVESRVHGDRVHIEAVSRQGIISHHTIRAMLVAMGDAPPSDIDEVLAQFSSAPGVRYIRVLDQQGNIRHSSQASEVGRPAADFPGGAVTDGSIFFAFDDEGDRSYARIYEPVASSPRCQRCHGDLKVNSIMELKLDMTSARDSLEKDRLSVLAILVGGQISLVVLVFLLFRSIMVKPMRTLIGSMRRVAAGELDHAVDIDTPREFAELGHQFNDMVSKLRVAQEERDRYYRQSMARAAQMVTVGELATAMAHEIRNPLTGISGALQVLGKDPALAARQPVIREILSTVDRLSKTISDLLAYGRPSKPTFERCNLNLVVGAAVRLLRDPASRSHDIAIIEELDPDLPPVMADAAQLQQVLLNVLLNAVQAMPDGGTIRVRSAVDAHCPDGPCVRVSVSDDGPGVPAEHIERIFAPFYTTKPKGTGLGLAISQRIAEENHGRLIATLNGGKGLTLHLELPLDPPATG